MPQCRVTEPGQKFHTQPVLSPLSNNIEGLVAWKNADFHANFHKLGKPEAQIVTHYQIRPKVFVDRFTEGGCGPSFSWLTGVYQVDRVVPTSCFRGCDIDANWSARGRNSSVKVTRE
jgi:hypothetical protein